MKRLKYVGITAGLAAGLAMASCKCGRQECSDKAPADAAITVESAVDATWKANKLPENALGVIDHGVCTKISYARGVAACTLANGTKQLNIFPMDSRGGYEFLGIDVNTGKITEVPMPFDQRGDSPFAFVLSKANKFYTHFGCHFVEYDPDLAQFTACHESMAQMSMMMTEGPDGKIWSATYPKCGLVSYDPVTKVFTDYGYLNKENWHQYPRTLEAAEDGWIYIGIGSTNGQVIAFNPADKTVVKLFADNERPNPSTGVVYRGVDGSIFGGIVGKDSKQRYSFKDGKRTEIAAEPARDNSCLKGHQETVHGTFADGTHVEKLDMAERTLTVKDPDGAVRTLDLDYSSEGGGAMSMAALDDGNIYGGTWFPMRMFKYNPREDVMQNHASVNQFNTVYAKGNYLYVGAYSGGYVFRYDCTKPWDGMPATNDGPKRGCNPEFYCKYSREANRPHCITTSPDGNTILMGGTPAYGTTGGGLIIVDAESGDNVAIPHTELAENEAVHYLYALDDNRTVIICTTTTPGTGGERKAKDTSIIAYDFVEKSIIWSIKPFAGSHAITCLHRLDENRFLGVVDYSRLFVLDIAKKEILGTCMIPEEMGQACSDQGPRLFFDYGEDILMTLHNGIAKIRVEGDEPVVKSFAKTGGTGNGGAILNGRFYFVARSHLKSLNLEKTELFEEVSR